MVLEYFGHLDVLVLFKYSLLVVQDRVLHLPEVTTPELPSSGFFRPEESFKRKLAKQINCTGTHLGRKDEDNGFV